MTALLISLVASIACKVKGRTGVFELCQPVLGSRISSNMALQCYLAGKTSREEVNRVVPAESGAGVVSREQRSHARL